MQQAELETGIKKPTLLLVWSNDLAAESFAETYQDKANFVRVKNVAEAEKLLAGKNYEKSFDGVITQYSFRGDNLDGVTLTENIRKSSSKMPVLFISNTAGTVEYAKKAGATEAVGLEQLDNALSGFIQVTGRDANAARILLVEDHKSFSDTLERVGQKEMNATFLRAANLEEASKLIRENTFDAAVISDDIAAKAKAGNDIVGQLKDSNKAMPVVVYSYGSEHVYDDKRDENREAYLKSAQEKGAVIINAGEPKEFKKFFETLGASKEQFSPSFKAQPYQGR